MVWTAKKTWSPEDDIMEDYLNEQVYGNTLWMYERPYEIKTTAASSNETDTTDYSGAGLVYKTLDTFTPFTLLETTTLEICTSITLLHSALRIVTLDMVLSKDGGSEYYYGTGTSTKPTGTQAMYTTRIPAGLAVSLHPANRITLTAGYYTAKLALFLNASGTLTVKKNLEARQSILRVLY